MNVEVDPYNAQYAHLGERLFTSCACSWAKECCPVTVPTLSHEQVKRKMRCFNRHTFKPRPFPRTSKTSLTWATRSLVGNTIRARRWVTIRDERIYCHFESCERMPLQCYYLYNWQNVCKCLSATSGSRYTDILNRMMGEIKLTRGDQKRK